MSEKFFRKGPQNAAKNKPHIPTDEELASVPASDERKTVILDEDLEGVDLEDRAWLYWKRNRNFIIFTIVAAFAIDRKSTRLNSSHPSRSRMPSSA